MQRYEVHFSGHVQGVGFRYRTMQIAERFDITGFVKNLPDGRVQMVVEGEQKELDRFVGAVQAAMSSNISERTLNQSSALGKFSQFGVAH